jgi:hypothetical protein
MFRTRREPVLVLSLALALSFAACAKSGEERAAELRARYEAQLNAFAVRQQPELDLDGAAVPGPEGAGDAMPAGDAPPAGDPADVPADVPAAVPPPEVRQDVMLDILVSHTAPEKLPGITLDVSHVGADQKEKGHWRVWVDTSTLERGPGTQVTHVLEDVDYQPGDGFHVEVRPSIPPEERSQYLELQPGELQPAGGAS